MAKHVRVCPHCYPQTGDTFEFECTPPVGASCDECGSRLQPRAPMEPEEEGWLRDRDYSEPYEPEFA